MSVKSVYKILEVLTDILVQLGVSNSQMQLRLDPVNSLKLTVSSWEMISYGKHRCHDLAAATNLTQENFDFMQRVTQHREL